jgi:hypothetical protein
MWRGYQAHLNLVKVFAAPAMDPSPSERMGHSGQTDPEALEIIPHLLKSSYNRRRNLGILELKVLGVGDSATGFSTEAK